MMTMKIDINLLFKDAKYRGECLVFLRKAKGYRQNELARILELSNASISYWENSKQEPTASALFKLSQFFGVSIDYLLGLEN